MAPINKPQTSTKPAAAPPPKAPVAGSNGAKPPVKAAPLPFSAPPAKPAAATPVAAAPVVHAPAPVAHAAPAADETAPAAEGRTRNRVKLSPFKRAVARLTGARKGVEKANRWCTALGAKLAVNADGTPGAHAEAGKTLAEQVTQAFTWLDLAADLINTLPESDMPIVRAKNAPREPGARSGGPKIEWAVVGVKCQVRESKLERYAALLEGTASNVLDIQRVNGRQILVLADTGVRMLVPAAHFMPVAE